MASPTKRRIVNIINFIRGIEPREPAPDLLEPVVNQVRLLKQHQLPATFLLQYDALQQARFVDLLKRELDNRYEIGVWLEIVEPLAKAAGIAWRGRFPWDWHSHVGFSIGYTPAEREHLIDTLMARFKHTFGYYPASMGSWFIDAHTLAYAADRYGIVASCNAKDQIGTDGYTLWGGYYSQAYYPSRRNGFMPAQSADKQIPVPVFRMLGSDPIYQYDLDLGKKEQGVLSLEPVYPRAGGSPTWVRWFFAENYQEPYLAFSYAQVGQENSFGWQRMGTGLTDQLQYVAELVSKSELEVETLAASGRWFKSTFSVTPATAVSALHDWQANNRRSVWYNSRFYRVNLLWEKGEMRIRDMHLFDEEFTERYLEETCTTPSCTYETLPVVDGYLWSTKDILAGIRLVVVAPSGTCTPLTGGEPQVSEAGVDTLVITWPTRDGKCVQVNCQPDSLLFGLPTNEDNQSIGLEFTWSPMVTPPITAVTANQICYSYQGTDYVLCATIGHISCTAAGSILITPNNGQIELKASWRLLCTSCAGNA